MKIKNVISNNKGAVISLVTGLVIAGTGVCKMLFGGKDQGNDITDSNYCDENENEETEENEQPEETTDEPE